MAASSWVVIDPLFEHITNLIKEGERRCLEKSLALFGSERDMARLQNLIRATAPTLKSRNLIIDFTPFTTLGAKKRFLSLLELYNKIPFLVAVRASMAYEQLQALKEISAVIVDDSGKVIEGVFRGKGAKLLEKIAKQQLIDKNFVEVRGEWFHSALLEQSKSVIRVPPEGSRYIRLHDEAWANKWIDVRALLSDPATALRLAYQMGYLLTQGYSAPLDEDGFVVGNNTAYVLAVFLSKIFEGKKLVMVDKVGPIPKLSPMRTAALDVLKQKQVCIVEDVVATGREIDMLALLALTREADVKRAVCVFDLELASSRFLGSAAIRSLCRPSRAVDYRRLPKFAGGEDAAIS